MDMRALRPASIAAEIRRVLRDGGSAEHAKLQWFFKEEIKSHGWYTADLRKLAVSYRREILSQRGPAFLLSVADKVFPSDVLEEKVFAVFLLESRLRISATANSEHLNDGWIGSLPGPITTLWCIT